MKGMQLLVTAVVASFLLAAVPFAAAQEVEEPTLKEKYQQAKQDYLTAKSEYLNARAAWIKARLAWKDERGPLKLKLALTAGKKFMLGSDKHIVRYLTAIRTKVEASKVLDDAEKTTIFAELDSYITWLEEQQAKIDAATTKEELQEVSKTVKDKWQEIKPAAKRIVGKLLNARIQYTINTAKEIAAAAQTKIDALKAEGKDTAELEQLLADFNTWIATAQEKHDAAKAKWQEITNIREADALLKEADAFLREAHKAVVQAHTKLKKLAGQIKALQAQAAEAEAETEAVTTETAGSEAASTGG